MKLLNIIALAINSLLLLVVLTISAYLLFGSSFSMGVIGGADGPTAYFITLSLSLKICVYVLSLGLVFLEAILIKNLKK